MGLDGVYQKPYSSNFVRHRQNEESSPAQTQREQQNNEPSKSKGLDYIENRNYPSYPKQTEQPSWQETRNLIQNQALNRKRQDINQPQQTQIQENTYANRSSKINIAQILKDFKNTQAAIGTPDNIKEEVNQYIELIEKQVLKDNPNIKLIKSNLKNASSLLDEYISKTLNKDSKVVENWVDALFLQQIDFKYNENDVNPQFLVKFPDDKKPAENKLTQQEKILNEEAESEIETKIPEDKSSRKIVPEDKELKSMFIKAKKLAYADEPARAITSFEKALKRANQIGDKETASKVFYEVGKIYDDHDYYKQALKSYSLVIESTEDNFLKTKAHYSMAQIYDDVNQMTPALDHYYVSAAYAGEGDNAVAQSTSLTKMGNIYTDMYDTNSLNYYSIAQDIAQTTDNSKVKGYISSSVANAYQKFGEPKEALKSYSNAVKYYDEAESPLKVAQNYMAASDVMLSYGNTSKSLNLLKKAQKFAINADDNELLASINQKIQNLV